MASIFKRENSRVWQIRYRDRYGRLRSKSSGLTDGAEARRRGNEIERRERDIAEGIVSPRDLATRDAAKVPIEQHIADFIASDRERGLAARRIQGKELHLRRFIDAAGIRWIGQIDAAAVTKHMLHAVNRGFARSIDGRFTREPEADEAVDRRTVSAATANEIRVTILSFLSWAVAEQRLPAHPCPGRSVRSLNAAVDRRRNNRAMILDEVARLLAVVDGTPRAAVYRVAVLTGLRYGELRALQWRDVVLESDEPCLRLRAEATKAKRADEVPLMPEAIEVLSSLWGDGHLPTARVFDTMPKLAELYRDLAAAGVQKVQGRRPVPDAGARTVSFHSLRKTFGTELARQGVLPIQHQRLMRHKSFATTEKYYTDLRLSDQRQELGKIRTLAEAVQVRIEVRTPSVLDGTSGCVLVHDALPGTQTASHSEVVSGAGLIDLVRGGASKRVKGVEPSTFTLAT